MDKAYIFKTVHGEAWCSLRAYIRQFTQWFYSKVMPYFGNV